MPSAPREAGRGSTLLQNNPAVIAASGYAVLLVSQPNPSDGRFTGAELAQRILDIADKAAAVAPVDAERLALIGHSYGGYNVLSAAPHSPRFAAVIASNGAADHSTTLILPQFYRTAVDEGVPIGTSIGWAETGQAAVGVFPEDAARYVALSPLYDAAALTTPALLIESDLDRPRYGALFGALYRLNREAAWLNYFGEGHTLASPANVRDLHQRILAWLGRYLGPPVGDPPRPVPSPDLEDGGE
ncbi:alpha/beta hydrolase family protein [Brevundimonas albigilva]|uniref:alpha/beta hydrolase family protein n=1 Tax=Brevundimonas albigilva TaxID=1312364 RepID=UPI003D316748